MAVLAACADGNFTDAATWALVDPTSYSNSETSVINTTVTGIVSNTFTPGAITIDGIGLKIANRAGASGTFTVVLDLAGSDVAGTSVTIDATDLSGLVTAASLAFGWAFFKFAAPVTLAAATDYGIRCKSTVNAAVAIRTAATTNYSKYLRTTTTQAPAAGDDMIIVREWTAAATNTTRTVTMNSTAATDYGSAATSPVTPALAICDGGTLTWASAGATNYILRLSGSLILYFGGTYNQGTVATPCPRDSSMELQFHCAADGDFGFIVRDYSTCVIQGLSRTSGKDIWYCKLNTDEAIASTSLGVDTDTGWLDNDAIAVASTTRTRGDCEEGLLNGNAGASTLTVDGFAGAGGGLAVAHSGTGGATPTQAEIILLTRNVRVVAVTSTAVTYFYVGNTPTVDLDWMSLQYIGTNVATKRGLEVTMTTGSFSMRYSCVRDTEAFGVYMTAATLNNITIEYCGFWNINSGSVSSLACFVNAGTISTEPTAILINGNIVMKVSGASGAGMLNMLTFGTITNNTVIGAQGTGYWQSSGGTAYPSAVFSGNTAHACSAIGLDVSQALRKATITNFTSWFNSSHGMSFSAGSGLIVVDGYVGYGNVTTNVTFSACSDITVKNAVLNSHATFTTAFAVGIGGITAVKNISFESCSTGATTQHTSAVLNLVSSSYSDFKFNNGVFAESSFVVSPLSNVAIGRALSLNHNGNAGEHKTWRPNGRNTGGAALENDTTIFNTASPSLRMYPGSATLRLEGPNWEAAVASGNTLSVSVTVRESVIGDGTAYAGYTIHPKLWVRANVAAGITADTLLATHDGSAGWVTLSGTTAAVTDDAILEFFVDVEGTAGWINVDDFTCVSPDSQGLKFWSAEHGGPLALGQPAGGGTFFNIVGAA